MRTIRRTAAFKRDYRREKKGRFAKTLDLEVENIVAELASDRAPTATSSRSRVDRALIVERAGPFDIAGACYNTAP